MMDLPNCPNHSKEEVPLVGRMEQHEGICTACIEVRLRRIADLEVKVHDLLVENEFTKKEKVEANEKVDKVQRMLKAEMEGVASSDRLLSEDQNPYEVGDECCVMWLNGWQANENRRTMAKVAAVIRWSTESLLTVQELARGYGQHEIADKVDVVRQKLDQFQGG